MYSFVKISDKQIYKLRYFYKPSIKCERLNRIVDQILNFVFHKFWLEEKYRSNTLFYLIQKFIYNAFLA